MKPQDDSFPPGSSPQSKQSAPLGQPPTPPPPADEPAVWPVGKVVGKACVIREVLGRSRASVTYRAFDESAQREVAVKALLARWRREPDRRYCWVSFAGDPSAMNSLTAEIELWVQLHHPHVVRAFGVLHDSTTDDLPAIVTAYCAGGSLAERLYGGRTPLLAEGLDAVIQVSWALNYFHDKQLTHLNPRSQNVLLVPDEQGGLGTALLSDPVLGRAFCSRGWQPAEWPEDPEEANWLGNFVSSRGAPTHTAPEFWGSFATAAPAIDVYAFGVLLYEVFCRQLPFAEAANLRQLREAHQKAHVPDPREWNGEIPPALAQLMQRCLAKEPSARPAGFGRLADDLAAIYAEAAGHRHATFRQRPATREVDLEVRKRQAWRKVLCGVGAGHGGEFETACRLIQEGEDEFRKLNDPVALQQVLNRHAVALHGCGKLDEAMALLEEQESLCYQIGDRSALAGCLNVQGLILKDQGQPEETLRRLESQEALLRGLDDQPNLSGCLFNQAGILVSLERPEKAIQKLTETESLCRQLDDQSELQHALHYHSLILESCDRLEEALALLRQEEAICRALDDPDALSACLDKQASILQDLGRQ